MGDFGGGDEGSAAGDGDLDFLAENSNFAAWSGDLVLGDEDFELRDGDFPFESGDIASRDADFAAGADEVSARGGDCAAGEGDFLEPTMARICVAAVACNRVLDNLVPKSVRMQSFGDKRGLYGDWGHQVKGGGRTGATGGWQTSHHRAKSEDMERDW